MTLILFYPALLYATWIAFLSIMALKSARDNGKLTKTAMVLAYPLLLVGWLLDFTLNMVMSLVFLDPPREWLLTIRCDRYLASNDPYGMPHYRQIIARWLCRQLLDPFQTGGHCRGIDA
jgi:hypothetical protein